MKITSKSLQTRTDFAELLQNNYGDASQKLQKYRVHLPKFVHQK